MSQHNPRFLALVLIVLLLFPGLVIAQIKAPDSHAIVNTSYLNVRSGDGVQFAVLAILSGGTRLEIEGRNQDSTWLLVNDGDVSGWARARYLAIRGNSVQSYPIVNRALLASLAPNEVVVNTSYLNMRAGAGVEYPILAILPGGMKLELIGRSSDWGWVFVEMEDRSRDWLKQSFVLLRGPTINQTIELLDDGRFLSSPHAVVNTSYLNMRSGDGIEYAILEVLPGGSLLDVLGQNETGSWYMVAHRGRQGWVNARYVLARSLLAENTALVAPAQNAPMAPTLAIVNTSFLNLRSADTHTSAVRGVLPGGMALKVLGRNSDSSWYYVATASELLGWVSAQYIALRGPIHTLQVY